MATPGMWSYITEGICHVPLALARPGSHSHSSRLALEGVCTLNPIPIGQLPVLFSSEQRCWRNWKLASCSKSAPSTYYLEGRGEVLVSSFFCLFLVTQRGLGLLPNSEILQEGPVSLFWMIPPRLVAYDVLSKSLLILLPFELLMSVRTKRS